MQYLYTFLTGGIICVIAQVLINKANIMPAKLLTGYVVIGAILSAIGLYYPIVEFGGCGATIPLTGFGHALAQGVIKEIDEEGMLGILTGGLKAVAGGVSVVVFFSFLYALICNAKTKE